MERTRILVCGGRDFNDWNYLATTLDDICHQRRWILPHDDYGNYLPDVIIISGMAKGADTLVIRWADLNWCKTLEFYADWNKYKKAAGPIRNQQMLDEGKPDLVIAFPTPTSKGTWDMVRRAKKAGVETIIATNKEV